MSTRAPGAPARPSLVAAVVSRLRAVAHELARFGTVGAVCAVVDIVLFNLLRSGADLDPLSSKAVAGTVAATLSYFLNRHWTWRHRARTGLAREYRLFIGLSAVGLAIAEVCLVISHYVLGLTHPVWDNLSANGVGLVLGAAWRFWSFKRWVFLPIEDEATADHDAAAAAAV